VNELFNQATSLKVEFEIIVLDDCSNNQEIREQNEVINQLVHCRYEVNKTNLGRGLNINKLVSLAKYETVLIMDCDTMPVDSLFIERYIKAIQPNEPNVIFGGIIYQKGKPKENEMLRWVYGNSREAIPVNKRKQKPYHFVLTSNLLISKNILEKYPFPDYIKTYGFEDLVFVNGLKVNGVPICHIDNPSLHLNLETSTAFITKFHSSLHNLHFLVENNKIDYHEIGISSMYYKLKKAKLIWLMRLFFDIFKNRNN
jgi:glycosyltransferase involved in cell wall biosynthesis